MKQILLALLLLPQLVSQARADLILPYRDTVGNWFVYQYDDGCSAVTEAWGESIYVHRDANGWELATDAPIWRAGEHDIIFDGETVKADFHSRNGMAELVVPTWIMARARSAHYVDFEPGQPDGLFALNLASEAIDSIALCFRNEGTEESRMTRHVISPFGPNCPKNIDVPPAGSNWTQVTFRNDGALPVLIYSVSREGVRTYLGPLMGSRKVDSYNNATFLVTDTHGKCLGDPLVVEGKAPVFSFDEEYHID